MIGVFDSGVGGLTVWRELAPLAPDTPMIYLADQANIPYGPRPVDEVQALTERCVRYLIDRGCSVIVIACNTASGAALDALRERFPETRFVGAEPAIKPAALRSQSGVIGVLATQTTFASDRYASLLQRFAQDARVIEQPSPDWVLLVENARHERDLDGPLIDARVSPLLDQGADVLVLGCTHFPFLNAAIEGAVARWRRAHPDAAPITILDPAPAIARQALIQFARLRATERATSGPLRRYLTTGDARRFAVLSSLLLDSTISAGHIDLP
jgi:glutamate racemase